MNEVPCPSQYLAQTLIAQEALLEQNSEAGLGSALRAIEKLRQPLSKLAGTEGFRSLLKRALTLATAYTLSLSSLRIEADGSVQVAEAVPPSQTANEASRGEAALLTELIGLLIAFIGESLTLQLLRVVWPSVTLNDARMEQKETPQ